MRTTIIRNVPQWAVQYLEDPSNKEGLLDDDVKKIEDFKAILARDHLSLICPKNGTENEFCSCPAFGAACATVAYIAEVIPPMWEITVRETRECTIRSRGFTMKEAKAKIWEHLDKFGLGIDWKTVGTKISGCEPVDEEEEGDEK